MDQLEDELRNERSKIRSLQRDIDDLTDANEKLIRDSTLRNSNNVRSRTTLTANTRKLYGSSSTIGRHIGSSDNLNRTEDNESVGTDGNIFFLVFSYNLVFFEAFR